MMTATHASAVDPAPFKIIPIRTDFLVRARGGVDDLGQPVERHLAQGGEPLRDCLRRASPGEAILLASYCPFTVDGPYKEYGPVFISGVSPDAARLDVLPTGGQSPYLADSFVLRAYSTHERIVDARMSSPEAATADLHRFFLRAEVAFVLARFPTYGCYALRIERGDRWPQ